MTAPPPLFVELEGPPPITVSALEFDVVWEHLRLGALPLVVKVPSPGKTHEERADLEARAWADLEARGLGRPVEVHQDIEEMLGVLAKPAMNWLERDHEAREAAKS